MQRGVDIAASFENACIIHHNLPEAERPEHVHAWAELIIPLAGTITLTLPSALPAPEKIVCTRGEMVFLAPDTPHSFSSSGSDGERLIVLFNPAWLTPSFARRCAVPLSSLVVELAILLLHDSAAQHQPAIFDTLHYALQRALAQGPSASHLHHATANLIDPRARKAYAWMHDHAAETDVIARAAKVAGTSERSLHRLFTQELGHSPKQVIQALRIEKAKRLLASGTYSVTATAFDVGYQSVSQFIKVFHDYTGVLPSQFRSSRQSGFSS